MKRNVSILWVSVLVLLVLAAAGQATEVIYRSPKQLADESSQIVRGMVTGVRSYWNAEKTRIFTEVRVKVDETYKGGALPEARIVQLGGIVDHVNMHVDGALSWRQSEEVLLFLERGQTGDFRVAGFSQGRFAIERDRRTGKAFVRSPGFEGATLVSVPEGRRAAPPRKIPLDSFVHETLNRE
jgi:hypothetical protein